VQVEEALFTAQAIGGSIHLNNELDLKNSFSNEVKLQW
jgi:iron complex outermembrane receptor protein